MPRTIAPGSPSVTDGGVLSTRRAATGSEIVTLPAVSRATARRSYGPSVSVVVSRFAVYGSDVSVSIAVQEPEPLDAISNRTDSTPEPVSAALAVSVTLRRRFAPGSSRETVGAVASVRATFVEV